MKPRILVTGAAGFVGLHLVHELVRLGYRVRAFVHKPSTKPADIATLKQLDVGIFYGDVTVADERLEAAIRWSAIVVHLAAIYELFASAEDLERVNVKGTLNVLSACKELKSRVILASSITIYGKQPRGLLIDELTEPGLPLSRYGESKLLADLEARRMRDNGCGMERTTILRLGPIVGSNENGLLTEYIDDLLTPPPRGLPGQAFRHSYQSLTHVHDAVDAIIGAIRNSDTMGKVYLVCGPPVTFEQLNGMIAVIWLNRKMVNKRWLENEWLLLKVAKIIEIFSRIFKVKPLWRLSEDAVKVMLQGYQGNGELARQHLLFTDYRDIREALKDMYNEQCSICNANK